eukprot:m.30925 g.30925  ORF g.30925 m.30925 type:complete len:61 (+) comp9349_c0_seq4:670-852(+)
MIQHIVKAKYKSKESKERKVWVEAYQTGGEGHQDGWRNQEGTASQDRVQVNFISLVWTLQ